MKRSSRGSIKRRSERSWTIIYDLPREPGAPRRQRTETVRGTKADAQKVLTERLGRIDQGTYGEGERLTFKELADRYLAAAESRLEPTTLALHRRTLDHHVYPVIGSMRLGALRAGHVQEILDRARQRVGKTRRDGPLNASSSKNVLVRARAVLEWGVRMGLLTRNVAKSVEPPKIPLRDAPPMNVENVRLVLAAMAGTALEAIVPTAIGTGLRRSELCALRWGDLDLDAASISVRRAAKVLNGKVTISAPKTKRSTRSDIIPEFVVALLRRHRFEQMRRRFALGLGGANQETLVFDRPDGSAWHPNRLSQEFSRTVQRKKLPSLRFHDLRHWYATLSFAAGVSMKVVSESLGHSSIAVTSAMYVHLLDNTKREKAALLDAFLGETFRPVDERAGDTVSNL